MAQPPPPPSQWSAPNDTMFADPAAPKTQAAPEARDQYAGRGRAGQRRCGHTCHPPPGPGERRLAGPAEPGPAPRSGRTAGKGLAAADSHGLPAGAFSTEAIDRQLASHDPLVRRAGELALMAMAVRYAQAVHVGRLPSDQFMKFWGLRPQPYDAVAAFAQAVNANRLGPWLDSLPPQYAGYQTLQQGLTIYRQIAANGGLGGAAGRAGPVAGGHGSAGDRAEGAAGGRGRLGSGHGRAAVRRQCRPGPDGARRNASAWSRPACWTPPLLRR